MAEPVKRPQLDATLKLYGNGKLPASLLKPIHAGGRLYGPAAWWFNVMYDEAKKDGIVLKSVSAGYRSYETQKAMFLDRYSRVPTLRVPKVTRCWEGKTYWLKRGKSPSAAPASSCSPGSNHGWGLAQDLEVPTKTFQWLCANGPKYGFYMEVPLSSPSAERWHWVFCNLQAG